MDGLNDTQPVCFRIDKYHGHDRKRPWRGLQTSMERIENYHGDIGLTTWVDRLCDVTFMGEQKKKKKAKPRGTIG